MKYKIIFWSPCLNKVGTIKSSIYSAISLSRYFNNKFEVSIINSCGEWNDYLKIFEKHKINSSILLIDSKFVWTNKYNKLITNRHNYIFNRRHRA